MDGGKTPTEAHSGLKTLIDALVEEVNDDDEFQVRASKSYLEILQNFSELTTRSSRLRESNKKFTIECNSFFHSSALKMIE